MNVDFLGKRSILNVKWAGNIRSAKSLSESWGFWLFRVKFFKEKSIFASIFLFL